jgi:hypothetical protein
LPNKNCFYKNFRAEKILFREFLFFLHANRAEKTRKTESPKIKIASFRFYEIIFPACRRNYTNHWKKKQTRHYGNILPYLFFSSIRCVKLNGDFTPNPSPGQG